MPHGMRRNMGFATVTTTSGLLMAINPKRFAVVISSPQASRITLDFAKQAVLDQGIRLPPSQLPLVLSYWDVGDAIHEDIFAIGSAGSETIGWMEIFFP